MLPKYGVAIVPSRTFRGVLPLVAAFVLAVLVSGCSEVNLPVTLSNFSHKATIVSNPSCESTGRSVIVTGDLVGQGSSGSTTGVGAVIYDSHGTFIGDGETPLLSVHPGQTVPFKLTASAKGTPASCNITWGFGPTGSTTGTPVGSSPAGGT